jgi:hypothetical protein
MQLPRPSALPRRKVVVAGLAALALGVQQTHRADARILMLRGMTGGGLARFDGDEPRLANFSLAASVMQFPEGNSIVVGSIYWIESGTGLQLATREVKSCVPMEDNPDGAEVRGTMSVNGEGDYPFVFQAIDAGLPGAGLDKVHIQVNTPDARAGADGQSGDADFTYDAVATVVAGDFQWILGDLPLD